MVAAVLVACSAPAVPPPAPPPTPPRAPAAARVPDEVAPIDPIAALAPVEQVSYLIPGRVQLELGGQTIDAPGGTKPLEVSIVARHARLVRVAIRLPHARFSVWTKASGLLAVLARDFHVMPSHRPDDETRVVLRAGAVVRRRARKQKRSHVRYVGGVEVEGWIPDELLVETGRRKGHIRRFVRPGRMSRQHVFPGAVIRREPRWSGQQLAVAANAYSLDTVRDIDAAWSLVAYDDADVGVQGFVSRRDPPGRVHRPRDPALALQRITPTGKVASGTCLYSRAERDAEPIGYIVGDRDVMLDELGTGWWSLTIDSPWGPLAFGAQGPTRADLVTCAPADSVPASTLNPSPPAPVP